MPNLVTYLIVSCMWLGVAPKNDIKKECFQNILDLCDQNMIIIYRLNNSFFFGGGGTYHTI